MIPNFTSSWDDGKIEDLELAKLLKKYAIPAVFYIPTCCEILPDHIRELSKDFEIGGHTKSHPHDLKNLNRHQLYSEIYDNKKWLEYLVGHKITKFCFPRGRHNEEVRAVVKDCGFVEARTTEIGVIKYDGDPFITPTTVHVFQRSEYDGEDWLSYAKRKWEDAKKVEGSMFHLWGHSREVVANDEWDNLEAFFKFIYEDIRSTQN